MALKALSSASLSRLTWIATNSMGGCGIRRASPRIPVRGSRMIARVRFSLNPIRAAISATDTPRLR